VFRHGPRLAALSLVKGADARGRARERFALRNRQAFERGPAFGWIQLERRYALSANPIEARGVLEHGCVAADTNVRENRTDGCLDRRVFLGVVRGQARQRRVEAWRGRIQSPG